MRKPFVIKVFYWYKRVFGHTIRGKRRERKGMRGEEKEGDGKNMYFPCKNSIVERFVVKEN